MEIKCLVTESKTPQVEQILEEVQLTVMRATGEKKSGEPTQEKDKLLEEPQDMEKNGKSPTSV